MTPKEISPLKGVGIDTTIPKLAKVGKAKSLKPNYEAKTGKPTRKWPGKTKPA